MPFLFLLIFNLLSSPIEEDIYQRSAGKAQQIIETCNSVEDSRNRELALKYIQILGTIDLLEFDPVMFVQNLDHSFGFLDCLNISDTLFLKYLLDYRIYYEPPSNYKPLLSSYFSDLAGASMNPAEAVAVIDEWADSNIIVDSARLLSPGRSVERIFIERAASEVEKLIFTVAAMRSLGIPSRLVFLPAGTFSRQTWAWLEFYQDAGWLPFYPDNPEMTGNFSYVDQRHGVSIVYSYSASGTEDRTDAYATRPITVCISGNLVSEDGGEFSVNAFCSGKLKPLDYLDYGTDSSGGVFFSIGEGDYYLIIGARDEDGSAQVNIIGFTAGQADTVFLSVEKPELTRNFAQEYMTSAVFDYFKSRYHQTPCVILLGDDRSEPYQRMRVEITGEIPDVKLFFADSSELFFLENEVDDLGVKSPIVIGLSSERETSFFISGYHLDIAMLLRQWLERKGEDR